MYLDYKPSRYKDKIYKSYLIVESYREKGKVKKRPLWKIGKLTDNQAAQIRLICRSQTDKDFALTELKNVISLESRPYLELVIVNELWKQWELSKAFRTNITKGDLSTPLVAKVLTINRCTEPCSNYSIPQWIRKTAIDKILGDSLLRLTDDKIYYELDKIEENKGRIEDHLFRMTYRKDPASYDIVNYDLSSSYFVGFKCSLSRFGRSKDDKPHHKQVILGLMVNAKGYPFSWDVYPGNTPEVHTLTDKVDTCCKRLKLKDVTMVFDRGIVSDDNLEYITDKGLKYISCLDKGQIQNIPKINLSVFKRLTPKNLSEIQFSMLGLNKYDQDLWFKDLGVREDRRYILGFNPTLFRDERESRLEKIISFEEFVEKKNIELRSAKRSRDYEPTRGCIINELKRLKIRKYFKEPVLNEIEAQSITKNGKRGNPIRSYQISIERDKTNIDKDELVDGLCVFVSNHIQKRQGDFIFSDERIIKAYRDKTRIEDSFKHIKSFLKIRPFFVNSEKHVKAVYTICVISYFINKDLAERRKEIKGIDYLNSKDLYEPFRDYDWIKLKDTLSGKTKEEPVWLTEEQKVLLKSLNINIQ